MTQFAFVFPGQGSQTIGMLSNLAIKYSDVNETFCEASDILGYDLWELTQHGPISELNKTWRTQPAILTSSIAIWRIWQKEKGKIPAIMAGHSLGEYSALVCANVISFADAVRLVEIRGKLMQKIASENNSAMLAIVGLNSIDVIEICKTFAKEQIVSPVSYNSPIQTVIAGHREAVERVNLTCKAMGAKCIPLSVNVPSHCILMKSAAEELAAKLEEINFNVPIVPVINNVDVKCETKPEDIRNALVRQLYNPVQWVKTIEYIIAFQDVEYIYEIGPGKVLTGLIKRINSSLTSSAINELDTLSMALL